MADPTRSPSVQSFASADSMSMPATSVPGSPFISSANTVPPEEDAPRVAAVEHDGPNAPEFVEPDAPETAQAHRFHLKDGNIKFELDDGTLYNVHRYFFEAHAPKFAYEYMHNGGTVPVKLPGVSSVDFERFLSIIYPTKLGRCDIHTVDEWTSVLRLATKWSIESLRELAIEEIWPKASPFDKVDIARELALGQEWLVPAFVDICSRPNWLILEEAERLGLHTVVEIGRIREEARTSGSTFDVLAAVRATEILVSGGREEVQNIGDIPQATSTTASSTYKVSVSAPNVSLASHLPSPVSSPPPSSISEASQESTLDSVPSETMSPADQLTYDALRSAEVAEEDSFDDMPLNRALFASHLARRLTDEKSPAALRHGEWRQSRVDEIAREVIGSVRPPEEPHYLNVTSPDAYRALSTVQERLTYLLAAKLPVRGSGPRPIREDKLTVSSMSWKAYDHITFELRREGWIVGGALGKNGQGRIYIAIPNRDEDIPKYTI